jgi:23S rRNA pseudouridine1911/1915/1917 synthase
VGGAPPALTLEVLFRDNHLLALNKPAGLLTQPSGTDADSLENLAKLFIKETAGKPGNVYLHAVHRLDRVASGIALFALTGKSLSRMNGLMRERKITRVYHAVVSGSLPSPQGELVHFLRHSRLKSVEADEHEPGARRSSLRFRTLSVSGGLTLIEVDLETGRYHQIRAQLGLSGCPILGDSLYGSRLSYHPGGIALHHRRMEFPHPVTKDPVLIEAAYPHGWPPFD